MTQYSPGILHGLHLFRGLSDDTLSRLERQAGRVVDIGSKQVVFEPGQAGDTLFVVLRPDRAADPSDADVTGQTIQAAGLAPLVQVDMAGEEGQRVRIERVVAGDVFGEIEFLYHGLEPKGGPRITLARAITPVRLLPLSFAVIAEDPDVAMLRQRLSRLAARRLVGALTGQMAARQSDMRLLLANWLMDQAADIGVFEANRYRLQLKMSQAEIAQELGVTRETVNLWLGTFQRSGLIRTGRQSQAIEILDFERLGHLARLQDGIDREAHHASIDAVRALLARGELARARNLAADALESFPSSPELAHIMALASVRAGNPADCLRIIQAFDLAADDGTDAVFDRLKERIRRGLILPTWPLSRLMQVDVIEDHLSADDDWRDLSEMLDRRLVPLTEDTAALAARALKEQAFDLPANEDRDSAVRAAADAYAAIHAALGGGVYSGINAAAMAAIAGDTHTARARANAILPALSQPETYWAMASRAEAELLRGDHDAAATWFAKADAAPDANDGARATTRLQIRRICQARGEQSGELLATLPVGAVAVFAGHMFRGREMDAGQQDAADLNIRGQVVDLIDERSITRLIGPLACGADIVIAEAALDAGAQLHAVLPLPVERFIELSVDVGDPDGMEGHWVGRFRAVLERASRLSIMHHGATPDRDLDGVFFHGFRHAAGRALIRADQLETECRLIAVNDAKPANNIAGTSRSVEDWSRAGLPVDVIAFPFERTAPAGRPRGASAFRPVLFIWPEDGKTASIADRLAHHLNGAKGLPRKAPGRREGVSVVLGTINETLDLAHRLAGAFTGSSPVRLIADFGLVLKDKGAVDDEAVAKLIGGADLPGTPTDALIATPNFAAEARMTLGDCLRAHPLGRFTAADEGTLQALPSQEIFAIRTSVSDV
ncbi:MAG: Crp/Fnr family transcriptional regulator [Pseudomonadota bacterium]